MESVAFVKMHGLGNDFVIIDSRISDPNLTSIAIQNICDRHLGVGCDQLIILAHSTKADLKLTFYNNDASLSKACGNGTRCCAALLLSELEADECCIETASGLLSCWVDDNGLINVDMGQPKFGWQDIPLSKHMPTDELPLNIQGLTNPSVISMGNPHTIFIVNDVNHIDIKSLGAQIEHHDFFPERTNVEFVQIIDKYNIRIRVWERGAGITLACGSGTCAATVALAQKKLINRKITAQVDGGFLQVHWQKDNHVILSGPIALSFAGTLSENLWQEYG